MNKRTERERDGEGQRGVKEPEGVKGRIQEREREGE